MAAPHTEIAARAVVFDFGGVVIRSPFELLPALERRLRLEAGSLRWRGPFDPDHDAHWRALQAGLLSERDYWGLRADELRAMFGGDGEPIRAMIGAIFDAPEREVVRPEVAGLIDELAAAGVPCGVLTNDLADFHGEAWMRRLRILRRFAFVVDGSTTGVLKPDPEAFRMALDRIDLPPASVLFVDDQSGHLSGAAAVGMRTLHFDVCDPVGSVARVREAVALA
jgi:putative hydrolase of the HAD superfamily